MILWEPENSGIGSRLLDWIYDFKYFNEHKAQQLGSVNTRGFMGSVNILESCNFQSQFYPLYGLFFCWIYVLNEKI